MGVAIFRASADFPLKNSLSFIVNSTNEFNCMASDVDTLYLGAGTYLFSYQKGGKGRTINNAAGATINNIATSNGRVFVGQSAGAYCYYSDDKGATLAPSAGITQACRGIAALGNTVFYAGTTTNFLSTDFGANFAPVALGASTSPSASYTDSLKYLPGLGLFVLCGTAQKILTSVDAITWNTYQLNVEDVGYTGGNIVAVCEHNGDIYGVNTRGRIFNLKSIAGGGYDDHTETSFYTEGSGTSGTWADGSTILSYAGRVYSGHFNGGLQFSDDGAIFTPYNYDGFQQTRRVRQLIEFDGDLLGIVGYNVIRSMQS